MPTSRRPVRKATTTSRPVTQKTTTRVVQKVVVEKNFNTVIAKIRKDLAGQNVFVLSIPWEAKSIATTTGAKWNPDLRQFLYEGGRLPAALAPYESEDYSLERWIEDELNRRVRPVTPTPSSMTPRPHQNKAIKKIVLAARAGWRGFILADGVGIGKSLEAVIGAHGVALDKGFTTNNKAATLIVCPKSVIPHWRNTIKASGVTNLRVVIINYDQAKKLLNVPASAESAAKTKTKNSRTASQGSPTIQWDIIVADEAHKMKNYSQRNIAFGRIARYGAVADKAPFVVWASATVGQNPLELGYLAPLISQLDGGTPISVKEWGDWLVQRHYHVKKSIAGNYTWLSPKKESSPSDISAIKKAQTDDVTRLSEILFSPKSPSIRRIPENIADWPSQTHIPTPVVLENAEERLYQEAWNTFRIAMKMNPRGKNPQAGLAATLRFRQKASLIRAPHTAQFANDLLDNGMQVGISVEFLESLDVIKDILERKGWHCAEFSGRNVEERENERIRFQQGKAQVILFTAQEGISLHAGEQLADGTHATMTTRSTLIHDIRYSSIAMTQILGRLTRDGQLANAFYMYAEKTIESQILHVMLGRMKNLKTLSGDDEETLHVIQDILDNSR
jgi:superfamily II DNA or RNA helicase